MRFALLKERSNSFAMVFGLEQFGQAGTDPRPKFLPIRISARRSPFFNFLIASGGFDAILRASSVAVGINCSCGTTRETSRICCAIGIDDVAGEQQLRRRLATHELREAPDSRYVAA